MAWRVDTRTPRVLASALEKLADLAKDPGESEQSAVVAEAAGGTERSTGGTEEEEGTTQNPKPTRQELLLRGEEVQQYPNGDFCGGCVVDVWLSGFFLRSFFPVLQSTHAQRALPNRVKIVAHFFSLRSTHIRVLHPHVVQLYSKQFEALYWFPRRSVCSIFASAGKTVGARSQ